MNNQATNTPQNSNTREPKWQKHSKGSAIFVWALIWITFALSCVYVTFTMHQLRPEINKIAPGNNSSYGLYEMINIITSNVAEGDDLPLKTQERITQISGLINKVEYIESSSFFPEFLIGIPDQGLLILLILALGALGGALNITRTLVDENKGGKTLSWYLFTPILGAVTALIMYIAYKSGASAFGAEATSPFMVAFIAVLSGLMSEHAYNRLEHYGRKLFQIPLQDTPRWANNLQRELDANSDVSIEELAYFASERLDTVQDWCAEKRRLTLHQQAVVAAYLRINPRSIFTDQN